VPARFVNAGRHPAKYTGRVATTIAVTPTSLSISSGTSALTAVVLDQFGVAMAGVAPDSWSSSGPGVVTVNSSGVVTFVGIGGPVNVTASLSSAGITSNPCAVTGTGASGTNLFKLDFNTMTASGPTNFTGSPNGQTANDPWAAGIDIVADPFGTGRGNVGRIHFVTNPAGGVYDSNFALFPSSPSINIGLGSEIWFSGEFALDALADMTDSSTQVLRKLFRFGWGGGSGVFPYALEFEAVLHGASSLGIQQETGSLASSHEDLISITALTAGVWHTVKAQLKINSSFTATDGIARFWLDGNLLYEDTARRWSDPAWVGVENPANYVWNSWGVGYQAQRNVGGGVDEYRYWNNLSWATAEAAL